MVLLATSAHKNRALYTSFGFLPVTCVEFSFPSQLKASLFSFFLFF